MPIPLRPCYGLGPLASRIILTAALLAAAMPSGRAAIGADGFLMADGAALHDHRGAGAAVVLRGVNLGGWLEWQDWMCPIDASKTLRDANPGHNGYDFEVRRLLARRFGPAASEQLIGTYEDAWITARDLDHIQALGMNVVRATFAYDTLLDDDGTWRPDAFQRLDWLVQAAAERGIYTVLDYHAFLPPGANQDGSANGYWSNPAQQAQTVQIWTHIAEHYRGNPAVAMYDLLNEPNNSAPNGKPEPAPATVCALYDRLYHAIRAADPDHAIAMEGLWSWTALRDPRQAGYRNVVYSLHWYHFGQKNLAENNARTDGDVRSAAKMRQTWNIPCLIGEFNLFGDPAAWRYGLRAYDAAGLNWALWTYKNKGAGTDSWGVYTTIPGKAPPVPDLTRDAAGVIQSKWRAWATNPATFALNPMLGPVLQETKPEP
jgi:endoglucanase